MITTNENKFLTMKRNLEKHAIELEHVNLSLPEIQSYNVDEIISGKLNAAFEHIKKSCIVHDSGFFIPSLNGFPGALVHPILDKIDIEGPKDNNYSSSDKLISITAINIRLGGDVHSLPGKDVEKQFFLDVPFNNRLGNGLLPDNLKGPNITVSDITVDKPFELVSIKPALPIDVSYMSKEVFKLELKGPDGSYSGPLLIKFGTSSNNNIDVSISKVMLVHNSSKVELEGSTFSMNIKKGQIFKRDIQLYKVLSYQAKIEKIEISKPFEIMEITPKPPFILDIKDSYVASFLIKAPDFNYAGDVEITFY